MVKLVQAGWRPPPLTDAQADRLLGDIERVDTGRRHDSTLDLAPSDKRILDLCARGLNSTEISAELGLSTLTVLSYQRRIRRKLAARTNAHAVALAFREGLLS